MPTEECSNRMDGWTGRTDMEGRQALEMSPAGHMRQGISLGIVKDLDDNEGSVGARFPLGEPM